MPIFVPGNLPFSKTAAKVAIHNSFKKALATFFTLPFFIPANNLIRSPLIFSKSVHQKSFLMKQLVLLGGFMTLLLSFSHAQIEKGTIMIGGNSSLGVTGNGFTLSMSPRFGYFLLPDFAIGAQANAATNYYSDEFRSDLAFYYDLGIFVRQYFSKQDSKWKPFIHGEMNSFPTLRRLDGAIGGGLAYFITPKVSIETQLLFKVSNIFDGPGFSVSGLNIGFHVFLPSKVKE